MNCHRIVTNATFVYHSLPNADVDAVEGSISRLCAIGAIISSLDHPYFTQERQDELLNTILEVLSPLEDFLENPPPHPSSSIPREQPLGSGGAGGRPRLILDLHRAIALHDLGNSWKDIAKAMGVSRQTLYSHLNRAGISTARPSFTEMDDAALDEVVASICREHPFIGATIMRGHLEARGIHLPRKRIQESLRRVDAIGVLLRWANIIRRKVYKVRGANAVWHHDGNEKLKLWGFYIHGCVDGHSRLLIYSVVCSNKRQATVAALWTNAVAEFGWPSRARGDFGTENNEVERMMIAHWGEAHRAYIRGRSLHNVRIERTWRDVRKDALETFRQIFMYLESCGLLDMENDIHRVCLYLVFRKRIQDALDRARDAWNHHQLRTEGNRSPIAIYELSREEAIRRGYWTGDADIFGDDPAIARDPAYGVDGETSQPFVDTSATEPLQRMEQPQGIDAERAAGIVINDDDEMSFAQQLLEGKGFDWDREDDNWGIYVYCEAVQLMASQFM